ncbi:MAG: response regulator transcription factor [Chitinophagaceae bacterium]
MKNDPIRIILVDDHKIVRESWKALLENNPRFRVIADCDNGADAIAEANRQHPDIVLVDINMSPLNGFSVTESIAKILPPIRVIGLSVNNQPKYALKMLELGASGYLTKTSSLEEILRGIIEVHEGNIYICEEVKQYMPLAK